MMALTRADFIIRRNRLENDMQMWSDPFDGASGRHILFHRVQELKRMLPSFDQDQAVERLEKAERAFETMKRIEPLRTDMERYAQSISGIGEERRVYYETQHEGGGMKEDSTLMRVAAEHIHRSEEPETLLRMESNLYWKVPNAKRNMELVSDFERVKEWLQDLQANAWDDAQVDRIRHKFFQFRRDQRKQKWQEQTHGVSGHRRYKRSVFGRAFEEEYRQRKRF